MIEAKIITKSIISIVFFLVVFNLQGQVVDADSIKVIEEEKSLEEIHSPQKATLYSAILPGLGQIYNKKWWKVPLIYGGFFGIGYAVDWNNDNYNIARHAYNDLTDDNSETNFHVPLAEEYKYDLTSETSTANFKDALSKRQSYYRRNRDFMLITMLGFYGLNLIDAGVDAHLFNFDMSDDLSFDWQPSMLSINNKYVYCINCKINF